MQYKIRCIASRFADGNIFPMEILRGQELTVDRRTFIMAQSSAPDAWELVAQVPDEADIAVPDGPAKMCTMITASGNQCVLPQKEDGLCHVHLRARDREQAENAQD